MHSSVRSDSAIPQDLIHSSTLVTGAASGIGAALAQRLLGAGARLAAFDCNSEGLQALHEHAKRLAVSSEKLHLACIDICDSSQINAAVATAERCIGPIDKLACVAGTLQLGKITELSDEQWAQAFAVNTHGTFNVCRAVAKSMMPRRSGAIVNVSSNASCTPRIGMGAYAASKAALSQMTRCLALELAEFGIRCNIVSPGSTDTAMLRGMWQQNSSLEHVIEGSLQNHRLGIPLARVAQADDIVEAILFLLSDRARHITLHDLRIDGGATLDQ